jgi:SAM-dependent methyltransferase
LATLATLFGLRPVAVGRCRVLELGCGDAGNLAPMALALPEAEFVGIDAAPGAIARGRALADAIRLPNLTLEAVAIEDFEPDAGGFDYVIAHGVYSWLPPPARDRLLALCARALARGGVAYVSYNALPGGRLREALRDMLRFHTAEFEDPGERIEQARALLRFLLDGWPPEQELRHQAELLLGRADASLLHDELADVNAPVYFHEFAAHAAAHGLQYLAEADFFEMQVGLASASAADALREIDDVIRREQYLDFLKSRMFRQTLLCHAGESLERSARPSVITELAFSTLATRSDETGATVFEGPTGSTLTTDHPLVIAALEHAARAWPAAVWVRDLGPDEALCGALLRAYGANLVQLHVHPPAICTRPGDHPEVSRLARHQAEHGAFVTNLRHALVRLEDDRGRRLVTLLDGRHDRAALASELGDRDALERSLEGLARLALFVPARRERSS